MFNPDVFYKKIQNLDPQARVKEYGQVQYKDHSYPLASVSFGNPTKPTLLIAGGVHGLERIGAQVAMSLMEMVNARIQWDQLYKEILEKVQIVFIPMINPIGLKRFTRSNGNSVDLMRNAPISADGRIPFLGGGHNYSKILPWYRGAEVQTETQFVLDVVKDILKESNQLISVDCHSGFGLQDQLWFPFATTKNYFSQLNEVYALLSLFEHTYPNHFYKIEPQSANYITHGDIWDYAYFNLKKEKQIFIPLTLEMGSWSWIKKNPFQLISPSGLFNPVKPHRTRRALRRHVTLFDFLLHALASSDSWCSEKIALSYSINQKAIQRYYGRQV